MSSVQGIRDPRFDRVAEMLADNIEAGREVGASVFVSIDGDAVVDLWGGWRERERLMPWSEDTIVNVFSGSKTVTSLAVLMLIDRGHVDLDTPVATYWPEFAQNGKARVTVRHLISHAAGLPGWEPPFSIADAMNMVASTARLAAQAPFWEPGTRSSYHASTFGHLVGELVRRVSGKSLSRFIAEEIAGPLGADFYLGLDDAQIARAATVYPAEDDVRPASATGGGQQPDDPLAIERVLGARTRLGSFSGAKRDPLELFNSTAWRRVAFGGSSGHANARGLGRIMTVLANGGMSQGKRVLSPSTIAQIFEAQFDGVDAYYLKPIRWGVGYALGRDDNSRGPLPFIRPGGRTCFWYGTGGSLAIADLDRRVAVAYVMNQCRNGKASLNGAYYKAIYECL